MKPAYIYTTDDVVHTLFSNHRLVKDVLGLAIGEFSIQVRSNSQALLDRLAAYFAHLTVKPVPTAIELIAIESDAPELELDFTDWSREAGKTGRKDSYVDLGDSRIVRKLRTGMVFLQNQYLRIAAGPCLANDNQVINFINAQYMNWLQHQGWLICHAAGLVYRGKAYAFAGFSGGGKSTLLLHLLNQAHTAYLTNDRLFVRSEQDYINSAGIAKLPRVNPGTIVHNPRLHGLIAEQQRQALLTMPAEELWQLEDKYDVFIEQIYGAGRMVPSAPLEALIILNWQHASKQALTVEQVRLAERHDLLAAVMKSPGPFYQYPDGRFYRDTTVLPKQDYLETLKNLDIYEVKGGVDFDNLCRYCRQAILG